MAAAPTLAPRVAEVVVVVVEEAVAAMAQRRSTPTHPCPRLRTADRCVAALLQTPREPP